MKVHWITRNPLHQHGAYVTGRKNGTRDKRRITCEYCRWKAGLNPGLYDDRKTAAPAIEPLGICARRQVLAMVMGLA